MSTPEKEMLPLIGTTTETTDEAWDTEGRVATLRVSSGVRVLLVEAPKGPRLPPLSEPGLTVMRFDPRSFIWPEMLFWTPLPSEVSVTTAATPMTMPRAARAVRKGFVASPESPIAALRKSLIVRPLIRVVYRVLGQ